MCIYWYKIELKPGLILLLLMHRISILYWPSSDHCRWTKTGENRATVGRSSADISPNFGYFLRPTSVFVEKPNQTKLKILLTDLMFYGSCRLFKNEIFILLISTESPPTIARLSVDDTLSKNHRQTIVGCIGRNSTYDRPTDGQS